MKNAFLIAFALLFTVAAQAVTITWSGNKIETLTNVDYTKDITIVYSYTRDADVSGRTKMLEIALNGENMATAKNSSLERHTVEFRNAPMYGGPNVMHFSTSSDDALTPRQKLDGAMAAGTHQLTLTINAANKTCQIDFVHGSDSSKNYSGTLNLNNDLLTNEDGELIIGTFEATSSTTTVTYASVPEPTALALLALGVAGLMLRRKA